MLDEFAEERVSQGVAQVSVRLGVVSRRRPPVVEPRRQPPQFRRFGRVAGEPQPDHEIRSLRDVPALVSEGD